MGTGLSLTSSARRAPRCESIWILGLTAEMCQAFKPSDKRAPQRRTTAIRSRRFRTRPLSRRSNERTRPPAWLMDDDVQSIDEQLDSPVLPMPAPLAGLANYGAARSFSGNGIDHRTGWRAPTNDPEAGCSAGAAALAAVYTVGLMFWLWRNRFVGSYRFFRSTSRS